MIEGKFLGEFAKGMTPYYARDFTFPVLVVENEKIVLRIGSRWSSENPMKNKG